MKSWKYINGAEGIKVGNSKIDDDYNKFIQKYGMPTTKEEAKRLIELAKKEGINRDYIKGLERGFREFYNTKAGNSKVGNAYSGSNFSGISEQELKSWIRIDEEDIKKAKSEISKYEKYKNDKEYDSYGKKQYLHAVGELEEAKKNLDAHKKELEKRKIGNAGEEFYQIIGAKSGPAKYKEGQTVKTREGKGTVIKVQPMKMSATPTYKIKLDSGKEVWAYEEEIKVGNDTPAEYAKREPKIIGGNSKVENGISRAFNAINKHNPEGLKLKIQDYAGQGLSYDDIVNQLVRFGYDKSDIEAQKDFILKTIKE